ncbi:DUF4231 domain-containing protein [Methylopila henanensis]|uniref:DUF4231 domain-containing protein n=1 Tax=Methylopila henanensis TaxID=873516 RepID=A0ABW4K875_9HYPH
MGAENFETTFLQHVRNSIKQNRKMADRAMYQFIALRLGLVVTSASLPALTTAEDKGWATWAAILVAVLAGLDTQFRWGEEWRHFRSTERMLERMVRDYGRREAAIAAGRSIGPISTQVENFDKLFDNVEALLQTESDNFFKFRVADESVKGTPPRARSGSA